MICGDISFIWHIRKMPEKKDSHHIWKESSKMQGDQDEPNTEPALYADKNTE